jgi:hypothetical protein
MNCGAAVGHLDSTAFRAAGLLDVAVGRGCWTSLLDIAVGRIPYQSQLFPVGQERLAAVRSPI